MATQGEWTIELSEKSKSLERRVAEAFPSLTKEQINWRPDKDTWSIGQQFDHILKANRPYFTIIENVAAQAGPFEKEYKPGFWGKFMLKAVGPEESMPAPVPKPLVPTNDPIDPTIIEDFLHDQAQFHELVAKIKNKDLNTRFSSPFAGFVKLKLGDAIQMNALHNERHLNKALRLLERPDFPR